MTTETIDKLFLELSQFTKAVSAREIKLIKALKMSRSVHVSITENYASGATENSMARDAIVTIDWALVEMPTP